MFQYFTGGGGALSNIILLIRAIARTFPEDEIDIVCSENSDLQTLKGVPNIKILPVKIKIHQEVDRIFLGFGGLTRKALLRRADIIWSLNLGSYIKTRVPQVLSVHNPHQVYPIQIARYHPDNIFNFLALRWFFRKSLAVSDAVIVQTQIMADYIMKISNSQQLLKVAPKAVENPLDMQPESLPVNLLELFMVNPEERWFNFLYVSTYTPHKNHRTLIKAFRNLALDGIYVRVFFTIDKNELIKIGGSEVESLINSKHIVPIGWIEKKYLKSLYEITDACLMPSVLESLSSAHLEAMQWGKPQITSDLPYARDLCGNGALYASAEDPNDWTKKIKELIENSELRQELVFNAKRRMDLFPKTWTEAGVIVHDFLVEVMNKYGRRNS